MFFSTNRSFALPKFTFLTTSTHINLYSRSRIFAKYFALFLSSPICYYSWFSSHSSFGYLSPRPIGTLAFPFLLISISNYDFWNPLSFIYWNYKCEINAYIYSSWVHFENFKTLLDGLTEVFFFKAFLHLLLKEFRMRLFSLGVLILNALVSFMIFVLLPLLFFNKLLMLFMFLMDQLFELRKN